MKTKLLILAILFSQLFFAQKKETLIEQEINHHIEMGEYRKNSQSIFNDIKEVISKKDKYLTLKINRSKVNEIINNNDKFISLEIPFSATETKTFLLKKRQLLHEDFKLVLQTDKGLIEEKMPEFVAYSGIVSNEMTENSMASITFVNNSMRGIISIGNKEYTIGPKNDKDGGIEYVLYEKNEVKLDLPEFACGTEDLSLNNQNHNKSASQQTTIPKCVTVHFEITNTLNNLWGGTQQSISKLLNNVNSVISIYALDQITFRISYLKIWTIITPYDETSINTGLNTFSIVNSGELQGTVGCLLGKFGGGGGLAWVYQGNSCDWRRNVCNLYNIFNDFPNYSWNVKVIAHEIGHNLGSKHTQWCGWTGGAIDNCFTTEGGCVQGPAPTNGGTIMSYCHLSSYGINFNNGFGIQPKTLITNSINSSSCFTSCETAQTCEDNVVSNVQINDNGQNYTISWSSLYPVKVFRRESISNTFSLLETVSSTSYVANYLSDCSIEKTEFKLVSVCPNGDSKPTIIVISPLVKSPKLTQTDTNLCTNYQNDTRLLSIQNASNYTSFQWLFEDNPIAGATNETFTANQLGTFTCNVTSNNGCTYISDSVTLTQSLPLSGYTYLKNGMNALFTNNSSCSNNRTWDFGDSSSSTLANVTKSYTNPAIYNVCINNTNIAGTTQFCKQIPIFNSWTEEMEASNNGINNNVTYQAGLCSQAIKISRNSTTNVALNTRVEYPIADWIPKQGTIELLLKVNYGSTYAGTSSNVATIFALGNVFITQSNFLSVYSNGKISMRRYQFPSFTDITANTTPFTFNNWHVVSISYGNQGTKIAVNGVVYASNSSVNYEMIANSFNFILGHIDYNSQGLWFGFDGLVDKIRFSYTQNDFQLTNSGIVTPSFTQVPSICPGTTNLGTIGAVSFVGDAMAGTAWNNDVDMYTTDNINYSLSSYTFNAGFIKFRKNHAWTVNWGSSSFPSGLATQNGFNIPITAGTYSINFNSLTGAYSFGIPTNGNLPTTSTNGVTGTWSPPFNNMATTIYTFTPSSSQCGTTQTMTVSVNSPAMPTGNSAQTFVQGQTLANLVVSGSNIVWYANATDAMNSSNPLPTNTVLVNGTTYYATQTINSCESDALAVTVSNLDFENANFLVYPNPVKENLFITNNESLDLDNSIKIYDIQGRLVISSLAIFQNDNLVIDMRNLSLGFYFIQLHSKTDDSKTITIKIIKE